MSFALALMRVLIGALMIGHGAQKLFGAFGGDGPDRTGQFYESLGLRPGKPMALAAGGTELGGGALLTAGLLTPAATAALSTVQCTAGWTVHRPNGPSISNGGYEYIVVTLAALFTLAAAGPGALSLDRARGRERAGIGWGLLSLAVGVGGAAAAIASSQAAGDGPAPGEGAPSGPEAQAAPAGSAP